MAYKTMLENISGAIENRFSEITAQYGFEYGAEYEVALCELLESILPEKYGICRGFIIDEKSNTAGDDIIIYARDRFPTIRLAAKDKYSLKQYIAAEAVYCYIEAKHTIIFGEPDSGQSFEKAFSQATKPKELHREKRAPFSIDPYTIFQGLTQENAEHLPKIDNPMFTAIIAKNIKIIGQHKNLMDAIQSSRLPMNHKHPDLMVLGSDDLIFPGFSETSTITYESPFFVEGRSKLIHKKVTDVSALSVGIVMLLYALDMIKLGKMPYQKMFIDFLKPNKLVQK